MDLQKKLDMIEQLQRFRELRQVKRPRELVVLDWLPKEAGQNEKTSTVKIRPGR